MKRYLISFLEGNHDQEFSEIVVASSHDQARSIFMDRMHFSGGTDEVNITFIRQDH